MLTATSSGIQVLTLVEYKSGTLRCDPSIAAQIRKDGHVFVGPVGPGEYEITARHKVGVLQYPGLEIRILPKVPIARLLYLASYSSGQSDAWEDLDALLSSVEDPLSAIAHALVYHAEAALKPTPLQGYVTHESAEMRVRGRVLFDRQISARAGMLLPAELRYDEYELGIRENRVLKAGLIVINRFVSDAGLSARLRHLLGQLDGVEPWPIGQNIEPFAFSRLNQRYRSALRLAELVLSRGSIEYQDRRVSGTAFLFNMNLVFESYLEAALRESIVRQFGGKVAGQYPITLDHGDTIKMKPDVVWLRSRQCLAVVDAKYKRVVNQSYPNADAYQMLAYCLRLGLRRGFLVYADLDGDRPGKTKIRNAGVEIISTGLDLSSSIEELYGEVDALALRCADLVRPNPSALV